MIYANRTTAWRVTSVTAAAGCLLYAMFAIAATDSECEDAWDDAPAEPYCTSEGEMAIADDKCIIGASACSISVDVTESGTTESETFSPTFPSAWTLNTGGVKLTDTDDIDICFDTSLGEITATVKTGCDTGETTSATATSSGLTLGGQ